MEAESKTTEEIGKGHVFTVLSTTPSPDDITEVGDKQTWVPPEDKSPGRLLVDRDQAFWDDKQFFKIGTNKYQAKYVENGLAYEITVLFERGRHLTEHANEVWMIYGERSCLTGANCEGNGPPAWGGQNAN